MELSSKILEQKAFITTPKNKEHMLVVLDKSTHAKKFTQPFQETNKNVFFKHLINFY